MSLEARPPLPSHPLFEGADSTARLDQIQACALRFTYLKLAIELAGSPPDAYREAERVGALRVTVAYGDGRLGIDLPDGANVDIVEPRHQPAAADPSGLLSEALRRPVGVPPLREIVRPGDRVVIAMCDGTRPQPRHLMIPAILDELSGVIDPAVVTLLVATGTHRANTDSELAAMLGDLSAWPVSVVNHDARDTGTLRSIGRYHDVPVVLNAIWLDADVRITTGFVEPHLFAGFSGGPKLVAPGLAGLETTLALHNAARIASPLATWGRIEGNPVHDDIRAIVAEYGGVDFALDVALNRDNDVVAAFGGELFTMHAAAVGYVRKTAMQPVPASYAVVITSNSGFPLDQNIYQSVKGMSAASQIVSRDGLIVCAAEARDGFPEHGPFRQLLVSARSSADLLAKVERSDQTTPDQWQAQILARIQQSARVVVHTSGLSDDDLRAAHLEQTADIAGTVTAALAAAGPTARVCVLPEGPQTIAYVVRPPTAPTDAPGASPIV
jgi:lactate racemase